LKKPNARKRALLIVNPRARRGTGSIASAVKVLEERGIAVTEVKVGEDETISGLIRAHRAECDLVIVGGGDGTLNAAAPGQVDTGLPLGVLPLGTANDFARTVGIPADPVKAAELIAIGEPRPIDLGEVNGHFFFNVASIGFSAELASDLTEHAKKRWGKLGYAIVAARILARSRLFTAHLDHDGTTERLRTLAEELGDEGAVRALETEALQRRLEAGPRLSRERYTAGDRRIPKGS
jgi:YegS/Rv2252/BmrU family lipid kinase